MAKEFKNYKNICILAVVFSFVGMYMSGTIEYVKATGYSLSPWLLPFLMSTSNMRLIVYSVFLFFISSSVSDLKIADQIKIRSSDYIYQNARIFSLVVQAFIYTCFIAISGILMHFPYISYEAGWGKILYSLSDSSISGIHLDTLTGNKKIMSELTPFQGMSLSFLLLWLTCILIGISLFFFSEIILNRQLGMLISGILIVLDFAAPRILVRKPWLFFSPLTWSNLSIMKIKIHTRTPYLETGIFLLVIISVVLYVLIMLGTKYKWRNKNG